MGDDHSPSQSLPSGARDLAHFMDAHRASPDGPVTHTCLAGGSYHIPGSATDAFWDLYSRASAEGASLHLTEMPSSTFPVLVDLDLKRAVPDDGTQLERQYDRGFVREVVSAYVAALRGVLATHATRKSSCGAGDIIDSIVCYVMERPGPYVDASKNVIKDGLHLVFPNVVLCKFTQGLVLEAARPALRSVIEALSWQTAPADSVVDDVTSKPWLMAGSCKPGRLPYAVTDVVTVRAPNNEVVFPSEVPADELCGLIGRLSVAEASDADAAEEVRDLVEKLSVRVAGKRTAVLRAVEAEADDIAQQRTLEYRLRQKQERPELQVYENGTTAESAELEMARKLVPLLAPRRAESYDEWMKAGLCLRNIDNRLLEDWVAFSKKCPGKYNDGECEHFWPHYVNDAGMKMGTLRKWAKEDDPDEYVRIMSESNTGLIDKAISTMAHFDVALVVQEEFRGMYVCVQAGGHGKWYRFIDHRWRGSNKAVGLRTALSLAIHDQFNSRANTILTKGGDAGKNAADSKKYIEMCNHLKNTGFKESVMRETSDLFHEEKFEGRLDSRPDLICFENGVYDLRKGEFRDGKPEDMVSMTTGYDYFEVEADAPEFAEIEAFFAQVFPDPDLRRYFLSRMAAYMSGNIIKEEFLILTGSGSNGKSKTIELLQLALGEYAVNLPTALMTQKRGASNAASPEIARLKGRRLAVMQEPSDTDRLNTSILKEATGSDMMQARPLYGEPFEFRPQFSMVMTCNTLPGVPDNDGGTWRRIKVVEFGSKFTAKPDPDDPTHFPIDVHLSERFHRWRGAFVCMLLGLYREERKRGHPLPEPAAVSRAVNEYAAEQDQYNEFVLDRLEKNLEEPNAELGIIEVRTLFVAFAKDRMLPSTTMKLSATALAKKIQNLGKLYEKDGRKFWKGWRVKEDIGQEGY